MCLPVLSLVTTLLVSRCASYCTSTCANILGIAVYRQGWHIAQQCTLYRTCWIRRTVHGWILPNTHGNGLMSVLFREHDTLSPTSWHCTCARTVMINPAMYVCMYTLVQACNIHARTPLGLCTWLAWWSQLHIALLCAPIVQCRCTVHCCLHLHCSVWAHGV